jgi:uncharacterized protein (TIGR04255 family)
VGEILAVELGKPPIIEAWVEFRFSVSEDAPTWDEDTAALFIKRNFKERFKIKGSVGRYELTVHSEDGKPSVRESKVIFERCRAATSEEDRYLQAGRDVLIYNMLRKHGAWPSYRVLRDEALEAFQKYVAFAKPVGLSRVALHYRDILPITLDKSGEVDLSRYLAVYPEVPKTLFGTVARFMISMTLPNTGIAGELTLVIRDDPTKDEPAGQEACEARFRLDWHLVASRTVPMEEGPVRQWLDQAHEDLIRAFRSCFTEAGWALLEPKGT